MLIAHSHHFPHILQPLTLQSKPLRVLFDTDAPFPLHVPDLLVQPLRPHKDRVRMVCFHSPHPPPSTELSHHLLHRFRPSLVISLSHLRRDLFETFSLFLLNLLINSLYPLCNQLLSLLQHSLPVNLFPTHWLGHLCFLQSFTHRVSCFPHLLLLLRSERCFQHQDLFPTFPHTPDFSMEEAMRVESKCWLPRWLFRPTL
mmetsp:Transcript_5129/g.10305  ORF Transcript_5129/g.10305 Transcript_5129/m.10305 type:complete len:200 (-) Transcript_5129:710-1309(-)